MNINHYEIRDKYAKYSASTQLFKKRRKEQE